MLSWPTASETIRPVTVAFIGDQGNGAGARAVLQMIKAEGADMVLHQGDFDYREDPLGWDAMISEVLGPDFPYFASIGNHDLKAWHGSRGYQALLKARLARIKDAHCSGDLGVMSACTYKGLFFILSGVGTLPKRVRDEPRHVAYLANQLAATDAIWRICSWHKTQRRMQLGNKRDGTGWKPYETCRKGGAIIATAHDHLYARTHLMAKFRTQIVASRSRILRIEEGRSFAFVSGLGGKSIRAMSTGGMWWAAGHAENRGADYGALFCTFGANGEPRRAACRFQDIQGRVPDRFTIISGVGIKAASSPQSRRAAMATNR